MGIQVKYELERYYNIGPLEDIRVIRDKNNGRSKGFGFLRFHDIQSATTFLEQNYPSIFLGNRSSVQQSQGTKVGISFSREREDRDRRGNESGWTCPNCSAPNYPRRIECYKCNTRRLDNTENDSLSHKPRRPINTGDSDASPESIPSQYLLVRGLEASVTEEILAKGIAKLYKQNNATQTSTNTASSNVGAKIASTTAVTHLGARDGSIYRVHVAKDKKTGESLRYGFVEFFTVEDATSAHTKFGALDRFTIASKPVVLSFIHAGVFVPVFTHTEQHTFAARTNPSLQLQYWDENTFVTELIVSDNPPRAQDSALEAGLPSKRPGKESDRGSRKRKAANDAPSSKKVMPGHLQHWQNQHKEIHGIAVPAEGGEATEAEATSRPRSGSPEKPAEETPRFTNRERLCCYLCRTTIKTLDLFDKHETDSKLHLSNLQSPEKIAAAIAWMAKQGVSPYPMSEAGGLYRDRAKERREMHGQSINQSKKAGKKQNIPGRGARQSSSPRPQSDAKDVAPIPSKGAALLSKMGYSPGTGLGAQGTGSLAPIATNMYAHGVGLGAAGGMVGDAIEEAGRNTRSNAQEFSEKTRDLARERYKKFDTLG